MEPIFWVKGRLQDTRFDFVSKFKTVGHGGASVNLDVDERVLGDGMRKAADAVARFGTIPCYLTIHDLHTWPAAMLPHVQRFGLRPILLNHGTTYAPCLRWLDACERSGIEVRHYPNDGCYGFFNRRDYLRLPPGCNGWYVVSDSDLDLSTVPDDVVEKMKASFAANQWARKVGVSLEIADIPFDLPTLNKTLRYEDRYWHERTPDGHWIAGVGATFAIYHRDREAVDAPDGSCVSFYRGVRLDRPYTARHLPWYVRPEDVGGQGNEELAYYLKHIDGLPVYSNDLKRCVKCLIPT